MATRRGNLEGTPGALLAANVTEIRMRPLQERWTLDDRFWREATPKILSRFDVMAHGHGYDARKGGLGRRLHRADEPIQPGPAGGFCGDEYTSPCFPIINWPASASTSLRCSHRL